MADSEVATKAPESDAAGENIMAGATPAQPAASIGEHCVTDRPARKELTKFADVKCYVARPNNYPHTSAKLLLLLSSGTGIESVNNQLQADKFASDGFIVVMPDMFDNDPCPNPSAVAVDEPASPSTIEQLKVGFVQAIQATSKTFQIDMWLARQTPEKVMPILRRVIGALDHEFADSISYGSGIYAVGYCFGGKYVLLLGSDSASTRGKNESESDASKNAPLIKAGAVAHATQVSQDDIENVNCPICLVCVEDDPYFPNEIRDAGKKVLESRNVAHDYKVYPKVPHGFAVVGEYSDENIEQAQQEAYLQIRDWLKTN